MAVNDEQATITQEIKTAETALHEAHAGIARIMDYPNMRVNGLLTDQWSLLHAALRSVSVAMTCMEQVAKQL